MQGPNRPTTGEQLAHAEWVSEAVRLSLKNWSARRIARKLGLHHSTVQEALTKELASRRITDEDREAMATVHRETIFRMLAKWEPAARIDKDAALVHHKYMERWAKLDGLDAPTKKEITGKDGGPLVTGPSPAEAARLVREAFGSHAARNDEAGGTAERAEADTAEVPGVTPRE